MSGPPVSSDLNALNVQAVLLLQADEAVRTRSGTSGAAPSTSFDATCSRHPASSSRSSSLPLLPELPHAASSGRRGTMRARRHGRDEGSSHGDVLSSVNILHFLSGTRARGILRRRRRVRGPGVAAGDQRGEHQLVEHDQHDHDHDARADLRVVREPRIRRSRTGRARRRRSAPRAARSPAPRPSSGGSR